MHIDYMQSSARPAEDPLDFFLHLLLLYFSTVLSSTCLQSSITYHRSDSVGCFNQIRGGAKQRELDFSLDSSECFGKPLQNNDFIHTCLKRTSHNSSLKRSIGCKTRPFPVSVLGTLLVRSLC